MARSTSATSMRNLQYRLNGVIVPEAISGFGTTFDPRIASSIQLITGTLPAQYGYRTAGVINFKTQSGLLENGGEIGAYGGTFGWLEPSAMLRGSTGELSYFLSGSYLRSDIGIENPTPDAHADPRPDDAVPAIRLRVGYSFAIEPHCRVCR